MKNLYKKKIENGYLHRRIKKERKLLQLLEHRLFVLTGGTFVLSHVSKHYIHYTHINKSHYDLT